MKHTEDTPALSLGNHIYLYRVLSDALGCNKQTFLPAVDQALADADLAAADLGFGSTRELLEELDDCIKLTVFKGGRVYATVIAQPAWDAALEAGAKRNAPATKSFKRKKADKQLKAVRPKHVKRAADAAPAPETDAVAGADDERGRADASPSPSEAGNAPEEAPSRDPRREADQAAPLPVVDADADEATAETGTGDCETGMNEAKAEAEVPAGEEPEAPGDRTTAPSDPSDLRPRPQEAVPAEPPAGASPREGRRDAVDLDRYPVDFTSEVYCPGPLLYELTGYLPYGADALGIVGEYFLIACDNGTAELRRDRATFPVRYVKDRERRSLLITMCRRHRGTMGAAADTWSIASIDPIE